MQQPLEFAEAREPVTLLDLIVLERQFVLTLAGILIFASAVALTLMDFFFQPLVATLLVMGTFVAVMLILLASKRDKHRQIAAQRFAFTNRFHYSASASIRGWEGIIFGLSKIHKLGPLIEGEHTGLHFWLGNYYYIADDRNYNTKNSYGFVRVELPRKLPHVLFDSTLNNIYDSLDDLQAAGLPREYKKFQRYELEGDFNNYFTVYAPARYERDMLYFITPELMALFVDYAADFDIEIIDDNLYIYSMKPIVFNAETLQRLFTIIEAVGAETVENTTRYRDDRASLESSSTPPGQGKGSVTPPGRRLAEKHPSWAIAILVWALAFAAMYLLYANDFSQ